MSRRTHVVELPEVKELLDKIVQESQRDLSSFERIKKYAVIVEDWNEYNVMTPSMKVKRHSIVERYSSQIEAMYGDAE
jgi:long-chain acyl-CoA synthetase